MYGHSHYFTFVACEDVHVLYVFVNTMFILKLFDVFFKLVFEHREISLSTLIIRYLSLT